MIEYKCSKCGAEGVKLWRDYNTILEALDLYCVECAVKDQDKKGYDASTDQIGWLVPAVPTKEMDTFWSYGAVPIDRIAWWNILPLTFKWTPELRAYSFLRAMVSHYHVAMNSLNGHVVTSEAAKYIATEEEVDKRATSCLDALREKDMLHIFDDTMYKTYGRLELAEIEARYGP